MKCVSKFLKKRRLLKKYKLTREKMENQIRLMRMMADDLEFKQYYHCQIMAELRCYNRLKKL